VFWRESSREGHHYIRSVGDLHTFSGPRSRHGRDAGPVRFITAAEGFAEPPRKTRHLRRGRRQEATSVVVNQQLPVDRETLRKLAPGTLYC